MKRCARYFSFRRQRVYSPSRAAGSPSDGPESGGCGGAVATGGANAGRNSGRKRPLAGRPDRPEAASRRDLSEKAVRFAVDAECCGALSCRSSAGLLEVEQNGEKRVLCPECAQEWLE